MNPSSSLAASPRQLFTIIPSSRSFDIVHPFEDLCLASFRSCWKGCYKRKRTLQIGILSDQKSDENALTIMKFDIDRDVGDRIIAIFCYILPEPS